MSNNHILLDIVVIEVFVTIFFVVVVVGSSLPSTINSNANVVRFENVRPLA